MKLISQKRATFKLHPEVVKHKPNPNHPKLKHAKITPEHIGDPQLPALLMTIEMLELELPKWEEEQKRVPDCLKPC